MRIKISEPTNVPVLSAVTQDDVWGIFDSERWRRESWGMIVARGQGETRGMGKQPTGVEDVPEVCPVWGDKLGYKDVTVVFSNEVEDQAVYWLEYVHGGDCVTRRKSLRGDRVALRSEYQCW